ncbi:MAG: circadian clock KaiB family protein [Candidatus Thiodiazotropha sp.]
MPSEKNASDKKHHFLLYIDSSKTKSQHVTDRLHTICRLHMLEDYTLEIIDLHDNPALFEHRRIIAVPTLEIETPESKKHRFVGDLSNSEIFIAAAGMKQEASKMAKKAEEILGKIKHLPKSS